MSEENVELVRRAFDLFEHRRVGAAVELADAEIVWDWSNSIGPLKGVYCGADAVRALWEDFMEAWEEVSWDPQEFIDLDDERVLVVNRIRMRGKGSGVEIEATGVQMWTIRDGKVTQVKLFQSKEDALST